MEIKTFRAPLINKIQETHDVKTFRFDVKMDFMPGHFVMLKAGERSEAFSISSSPTDKGFIELSMKMTGSEYKKTLEDAGIGDKFEIKGPYGHFFLDKSKDAIMIAGGIGITPFRCMARYAAAKRLPAKITLLYSNKTPDDIAFRDELGGLEKKNKNFKAIHTITRPEGSKWEGRTGRIDEAMIKSVPYWKNAVFYVCGPGAMIDGILELLKKIGVADENIRKERFGGY